MKWIGHLCLWIGFVIAAFAALYRLEVESDPWATVPWELYFGGLVLGAVGVVTLRVMRLKHGADEEHTESQFSTVRESLAAVRAAVDRLVAEATFDPGDVLHRIDNECAEPLAEFAEARQSLVKRHGLTIYAEVMTEFASAERYLNRCWSASADGYVHEARDCLQRAHAFLGNAAAIIDRAESELAATH